MVSLISSHSSIICNVSHKPISILNPPNCFLPFVLVVTPKKSKKHLKKGENNQSFLGFSGVVRRCKNWECESDSVLELELLEFMKKSKNPNMFPSKKELIEAGRRDLIEGIMKFGGWMTMGWEDEDEKEVSDDKLNSNLEFCADNYGLNSGEKSGSKFNEERNCEGVSSTSGQSLEMETQSDSGIDGILHRLERQRSVTFGLELGTNGTNPDYINGVVDNDNQSDVDSCHPQRNGLASLKRDRLMFDIHGSNKSYSDELSSSSKTDTWRTWSIQRAGVSDTEFEAGEIDFGENTKEGGEDKPMSEIVAITRDIGREKDEKKDLDSYYREITQGDLKARLQNLEVELSSALHVLKSNTTDLSRKARDHLPEDLRQLSDVSEFQENEIMNAQDKLRSLRAKLTVLEGKMSLAITDAQKILDEKQKRIDETRKALQLLRTTCIVWPNSGSDVLLAGSFDGWATQRKMTRSSTGVFSLCMKLYPGKYEIKFIVDGTWKVDPLRPIVNNNGFENNLLIIN